MKTDLKGGANRSQYTNNVKLPLYQGGIVVGAVSRRDKIFRCS